LGVYIPIYPRRYGPAVDELSGGTNIDDVK